MLEKFNFFKKEAQEPRKDPEEGQLLQIIGDIERSPELFAFLIDQLAERSGEDPRAVKKWFTGAADSLQAFGLARRVDELLGPGTFRKLSFVSTGADAQRNVLKILSKDLKQTSFEGQAEQGLYLNIKENYGVEWNLEKAARDILQNFFDGNGQTMDGIDISVKKGDDPEDPRAEISIAGGQDYDWRELVHLGGSTKTDSEETAGGFGEGAKMLSLILLRDFGAKRVKFSSRDWELDFYMDKVPQGSYRNEEDRGLFVKKRKKQPEKGNRFELLFEDKEADAKAKTIEDSRELFYSSGNPDFRDPSFENRKVGGFRVLPRSPDAKPWDVPKGNVYIAGQRMHYDSRDKWNEAERTSIWTWKKIAIKDRDRGMITRDELAKNVIPEIVSAMTVKQAEKSVRDFESWFGDLVFYEAGFRLLEAVVERLHRDGVTMKFKDEFIANNLSFQDGWIRDLLQQQGYVIAPGFMSQVGMISATEKFKKLMEHNRVKEAPAERGKISLLQEAARLMDLPEEDRKDVWLFSAEGEKNIFHGQYAPEFFWMAREAFTGSFFDALHTYLHEAAHKAGPHGQAKFEYTLQEYIKKIQLFMHEHRDEYERLEREWNASKD